MLYFHEKCAADVVSIIQQLKKRDNERAADFITALIDAYQRIYADEHGQHQIWIYDNTTFKACRFNVEPVRGFPFTVLFQKQKGKKTVLAVVYNKKSMTQFV
jgi:hypothetical protein